MTFKKNKFVIIKKALNKDICEVAFNYLILKRKVAEYFFKTKFISPYESIHGYWNDKQVPNTYAIYGDILMEVLLTKTKSDIEKITNLKLIETYAYARLYKKNDILKKHTDRFSCEISATLNLGGDNWPIYLNNKKKDIKINLDKGDMLIYKGEVLEHWREPFKGENCGQVFFHYNDLSSEKSKLNKYDTRPFLGLPSEYKQGG
jgi:hypothetical protein